MNNRIWKAGWTAFAVLATRGLLALEGSLFPTLATNLNDQWEHILSGRPPYVVTLSSVVRGQPFTIHLTLGKFALKDGKAHVVADLEQVGPNGISKSIGTGLPVLKRNTDPEGVFLSDFYLKAVMDEEDPVGEYKIIARLRDCNDGSEKQLEASWKLVDAPAAYPSVELKQAGNIMSQYYRNPRPEQLPGILKTLLREQPELNGKTLPMYYGCGILFQWNPQLKDELLRIAETQTGPARTAAAYVIRCMGPETEARIRPLLSPELFAELDKVAAIPVGVPPKIDHPTQLDQLWIEFFTTGKVEPIRRLVGALTPSGATMTIEEFKARKERGVSEPEDRQKLMNHLIRMAAEWSLGSNAQQHRLVAYYLEAMLARGEIKDPQAADQVRQILRKAKLSGPAAQ